MLDSGQRCRGSGDEKCCRTGSEFRLLNLFFDFEAQVNDVAQAGGRFGDCSGFDCDHAEFNQLA